MRQIYSNRLARNHPVSNQILRYRMLVNGVFPPRVKVKTIMFWIQKKDLILPSRNVLAHQFETLQSIQD